MPDSKRLGNVNLEKLFDEIIAKTERREAFSEIKETNIGFSAIEDMKALRDEFLAAETELDLWFALVKLSNARRDVHLSVIPVDGGLNPPEQRPCVSAPVLVLPDLSDIDNPAFFVGSVYGGLDSPKSGDVIVGANGQPMAKLIEEFTPWMRHSTLHGLFWRIAYELPKQVSYLPPDLYSKRLNLTLERPSQERYDVSLPYNSDCRGLLWISSYPGFVEVMQRENFEVLLDRDREIILLRWFGFELDRLALVHDMKALMEYSEDERLLKYDLIIDVTRSGGGSGSAFAIQRLVDRPFRVTFGNVRLSDLGQQRIAREANRRVRSDEPDIFGLDLKRIWRKDWAKTDAKEAIERGDKWTKPVPLRLQHLPKDSDGFLQPAPVHFSGRKVLTNGMTYSGSHQDQFVAMLADNDLVTFLGVPTGGFSNPYEGKEVLYFPGTSRPVVEFDWTISHTLRPNGEILEGNPAQPDLYIPITRDNFRDYHKMLVDEAIAALER